MLATGEENPVAKRENVLQKNISAPLIGIYGSELAERGERRRVAIFLAFFLAPPNWRGQHVDTAPLFSSVVAARCRFSGKCFLSQWKPQESTQSRWRVSQRAGAGCLFFYLFIISGRGGASVPCSRLEERDSRHRAAPDLRDLIFFPQICGSGSTHESSLWKMSVLSPTPTPAASTSLPPSLPLPPAHPTPEPLISVREEARRNKQKQRGTMSRGEARRGEGDGLDARCRGTG